MYKNNNLTVNITHTHERISLVKWNNDTTKSKFPISCNRCMTLSLPLYANSLKRKRILVYFHTSIQSTHVKKEEGEKVWERYQLWACGALTMQPVSVKLGQILNSYQNNLEKFGIWFQIWIRFWSILSSKFIFHSKWHSNFT